jgi:type I restriction enzyme S subunit
VSATGQLPFVALEHLESGTGGFAADAVIEDKEADRAGMVQFSSGDVMFGKLRPYLRKSWLADRSGLCSSELIVMRPRPGMADSRWLAYAVQTQPLVDWAVASSEGVKMPRTAWKKLGLYELDPPPVAGQRVIADYLDAETARIDSVLAARGRVLSLVYERPWRLFERLVAESAASRLPMRRALIDIADGPFGSAFASDDYVDEGAFVVRLGNIGFAEFMPEPAAFIPLPLYRGFPRCHVRPGDLLVAGLGDENNHAGRACVAPELGPAMVKGKCFCAVTDPSRAEAAFLALYLSSSLGAAEVDAASHGSTRAMINLDIVKSTLVPLPSLEKQREILDRVGRERLRAAITSTKLSKQIALLNERRQALITAAVTGQIEIPGVAA